MNTMPNDPAIRSGRAGNQDFNWLANFHRSHHVLRPLELIQVNTGATKCL